MGQRQEVTVCGQWWPGHPQRVALALFGSLTVLALLGAVLVGAAPQGMPPPKQKQPCPDEAEPCKQATLLQRAIVPEIETCQADLNNRVAKFGPDGSVTGITIRPSKYSFKELLAKGRHLFTTPFTEADGAGEGKRYANGEGPLGPREKDYNSNLRLLQGKLGLPDSEFPKILDIFQPPFSHVDSKRMVRFSILRLNGLDSQSCFECHNSIASAHPAGDPIKVALDRKPGTTGGPAGQASNAFINDTFPNPVFKFVRNPPHVFGTGYVVKLSEQMTFNLLVQKVIGYKSALSKPGAEIPVDLYSVDAKSRPIVSFGTLKVTYIGDPAKLPDESKLLDLLLADADADLSKDFREDHSGVQGVSRDLVVRPLQWKGIASNERNFVRSALAFHFGMAPKELNPDYLLPQENRDPDCDGVLDEVSEGNVSALTIFTMSIRPPQQVRDDLTPAQKKRVERGEKLFQGLKVDGKTAVIGQATSCANCHMPSQPLYDTKICVRDPRDDLKLGTPQFTNRTSLVARQVSSKRLPIYRQVYRQLQHIMRGKKAPDMKKLNAKKLQPKELVQALRQQFQDAFKATEPVGCPGSGYEFDLTMAPKTPFEGLSFSYPRLVPEDDPDYPGKKVVQVPLFSDLKRHDMGEGLADKFDQPTDVDKIKVERRLFLTRPLWGVADTGPWLHDGRARTLRDAILMHESLGSEANPAITAFKNLSCDDQAAIVEFLLTLRLPVDNRYAPCFNRPARPPEGKKSPK